MLISAILLIPMSLIPFMHFTKEEFSNLSRDKSLTEDLSYTKLLLNRRTLTTLFSMYACIVCMIFYEPLLTNQLTSMDVNVSKIGKICYLEISGYFFLFGTLSYVVFGPLVGVYSKGMPEKRYLAFWALVTTAVALLFFGPS